MIETVEVPVKDTTSPPPRPAANAATAIRRARRAPHVAVGVLVVAAAATRAAANYTGADAQVATWTAATAFVVAVVAATIARRRVFDKKTLRRAYAFIAVAAVWLTGVAGTGLTLGAVGLLMAIGYGLHLHWWRIHPLPLAAGRIHEPVRTSGYAELWAENVGATDGCLPGTSLSGEEHIKAGVRYVLKLRPGKQTLEMVHERISKIRGGLTLQRDQDLVIEPHPTLPEPHLLVTVVTKSPIRESVIHPGASAFNPETGRVALGPFVDGEGTAWWKAYTDNRLWGGFVQGGTGSGKSRLVESVVLSLAASATHPTVIFYGDGQGGASSPLLMKHADVQARTHDQILAMLEGVLLVVLLRQDENTVNEWEGFTPTPQRPGVLVVIDECHKPLSKLENPEGWERIQYLLATIAREGGKVGVAPVLASQQTTLDVFGGAGTNNSEAIRTNILAGNGVMLRSKDPNAKTIFGVDVNPKKFPPLAGYGLLVDSDPEARSAPFRGYYVTDRLRDIWPGQIEWRSLDSAAASAWGRDYQRRHEIAKEAVEAVRRRLAARQAGTFDDTPRPAQATRSGGGGAALTAPAGGGFPSWKSMFAAAERQTQPAKKPLHDGHRKVLAAIRAGHTSPKAIREAAGYSERQVHNLLGELVKVYGLVDSADHGQYALIDDREVAA
ncbi:hypothetical protein ACIBCR_15215 [Micromonospora echinospora]|uniref:hypothetical protein n=1 Tax=Micromonospora echinospora TaxID=1877 RepID=UPI003799C76B